MMSMSKNSSRNKNFILLSSFIGLIIAIWCCQLVAKPESPGSASKRKLPEYSVQHKVASQLKQINAANLDPQVLKLALTAYHNAKKVGHGTKDVLTVVDYSLPSTQRRMWVIDMQQYKVLHHTLVSHGTGSGDNYARYFSNRPGSHMSSLGLMLTGDTYHGQYGRSLILHGLDGKFNSNAFSRRIVVHAAHYVDERIVNRIGRLGRSFGCLALSKNVANNVMNVIKGGSLVFCYYPDQAWLHGSSLLRL
jgi:hypothetical protein